jgi:hypothetical protein
MRKAAGDFFAPALPVAVDVEREDLTLVVADGTAAGWNQGSIGNAIGREESYVR